VSESRVPTNGHGDRWFAPDELAAMSRPTMDRAIEAIKAGEYDKAEELCDGMKEEWRFLHDLMAEQILGLITFIQRRLGDDGVEAAWTESIEQLWRKRSGKILDADRREIVLALAATWRAHSGSGTGPQPGSFTITEDDAKFTFTMNPCGSGQRLVRLGKYEGESAYGVTTEPHPWSYGREGFPLYCTHCSFMNELLPIKWYGMPLYPSEPPTDYMTDPCTWWWYKRAEDVPDKHWSRYGLTRLPVSAATDGPTP
jgi:hypothetical protein